MAYVFKLLPFYPLLNSKHCLCNILTFSGCLQNYHLYCTYSYCNQEVSQAEQATRHQRIFRLFICSFFLYIYKPISRHLLIGTEFLSFTFIFRSCTFWCIFNFIKWTIISIDEKCLVYYMEISINRKGFAVSTKTRKLPHGNMSPRFSRESLESRWDRWKKNDVCFTAIAVHFSTFTQKMGIFLTIWSVAIKWNRP